MNPGQPQVTALKLRETGYALVGFGLTINADPDTGEVVISVVGDGGRVSEIVGIRPVQAQLLELARIPEEKVVELIKAEEDRQALAILGQMGPNPRAIG